MLLKDVKENCSRVFMECNYFIAIKNFFSSLLPSGVFIFTTPLLLNKFKLYSTHTHKTYLLMLLTTFSTEKYCNFKFQCNIVKLNELEEPALSAKSKNQNGIFIHLKRFENKLTSNKNEIKHSLKICEGNKRNEKEKETKTE